MKTDAFKVQGKPQICDLLVRNAYILTLDAKRTIYPVGAIAITGPTIIAIGPEREVVPMFRPRRVLDAGGAAVHPGFIESHIHITTHLGRGVVSDTPHEEKNPVTYADWYNALEDEDIYPSSLLACVEMLRNGVTCFMEAGTAFEPDAVAAAAEAVGIRCSVADPFLWDIEDEGHRGASRIKRALASKARALDLLGKQLWRNRDSDSLVRGHVALYGMGSASDELQRAAKACADENRVVLSQHQNFLLKDTALDDTRFGRLALLHLADIGLLDKNCSFVHMNIIRDEEVPAVIGSGISIIWHPGNYMFYSLGATFRGRVPELYRRGVNFGLTVDAAKAWTFGDMSWLGYIVARETGDFIKAEGLLEMQTIGGAKAMGLEGLIGSLEPGKRADLVIRTDDLAEAHPGIDVVQQLVLISRSKSVDTVIVNGRIVLKKGRLTRIDEGVVYAEARVTARRMMGRLGARHKALWPTVE